MCYVQRNTGIYNQATIILVEDMPLCLKYINTTKYNKINYVLRLTQLCVYFIIIILLLATSFGLKRPSAGQYLSSMYIVYKKVKYTLVQALRLCTGRTAHRGSRGIALLFLDHGTRKG